MPNHRPELIVDRLVPAILALNNAHATELSWLNLGQLESLLRQAFYARHIGETGGFLVAFDETANYDSPNYLWFRQRRSKFIYIDRVVVAPGMRGRGYARRLYRGLFDRTRSAGYDLVVCEVNVDPPNPVSDAFHATMGFGEIGGATIHDGTKTVRYLARSV
jgi:uncharacterized protein